MAFRRYAAIDNRSLRSRVMEFIWEDEVDKAALLCARTPGPVSAVLLAGLQAYDGARERSQSGETAVPMTVTVKEAMDDYAIHAISAVEKRFALLSTIGNAAPLMGMLGTVTGMIASFAALEAGGVSSSAVAGGISEALITTAGGLAVALIAVIPYNYFNAKSDAVDLEIEEVKAQFVDTIAKAQ
jgi:biopolymer transport protein ExbB